MNDREGKFQQSQPHCDHSCLNCHRGPLDSRLPQCVCYTSQQQSRAPSLMHPSLLSSPLPVPSIPINTRSLNVPPSPLPPNARVSLSPPSQTAPNTLYSTNLLLLPRANTKMFNPRRTPNARYLPTHSLTVSGTLSLTHSITHHASPPPQSIIMTSPRRRSKLSNKKTNIIVAI